MKAVGNWRRVLRYAWSNHVNYFIALATAIDAGITYWVDGRLSASLLVMAASLVASALRLVKQDNVSGAANEE